MLGLWNAKSVQNGQYTYPQWQLLYVFLHCISTYMSVYACTIVPPQSQWAILGRGSLDQGGASSFLIPVTISPSSFLYLWMFRWKNGRAGHRWLVNNFRVFSWEDGREVVWLYELGLSQARRVYVPGSRCFFIILHISSRALPHFYTLAGAPKSHFKPKW